MSAMLVYQLISGRHNEKKQLIKWNSLFFYLSLGMELKDNILVSGNADSTVKIWDIITGQCLQTLSGKCSGDQKTAD